MNFKKYVSLLAVCMLMAFTTVAFAGPARPISSAQCYAIGSDNTGWKYGASSYYAATFSGNNLYFAIRTVGMPDYWNQKIYAGGSEVPQADVKVRNFIGNGTDNYTYEVYIPISYAKWGMIDIPVKGTVGGSRTINLNKIKTE